MVLDFFLAEYGEEALGAWARFEGLLPLMARGGRFIASHAEPRRAYSPEEIIGARGDHDVVTGLTWTRDGESAEGSVNGMLESFLPGVEGAFYFGGHRIVSSGYALRAGGRFVQLHDPVNRSVACVAADAAFNPERDVRSVK